MWTVEDIELLPVELDLSSSGQGKRRATACLSRGALLFNAIELVEVDLDATQVEICAQCGCTGCSSGGWVSFRRVGDSVVWLPAWAQ